MALTEEEKKIRAAEAQRKYRASLSPGQRKIERENNRKVQAEFVARLRAAGKKPHQIWCLDSEWQLISEFAKKVTKQNENGD